MKKLLFFIFLIVLFSCEKEQPHCWECFVYTDTELIVTVGVSGITETELKDFKAGLSTQTTALTDHERVTIECIIIK